MLTQADAGAGESGYGLGLQFSAADGALTVAGHGGSVAGYTAHIAFDPQSKIGVILLRNYGAGRTNLGERRDAARARARRGASEVACQRRRPN